MGQRASLQNIQPSPENDPNPEVAWWCKLLARGIAIVAAIIALVMGIWVAISVHATCILAGILQMIIACLVLVFEAPCCCMWLEGTKPIANFAERRSFFQKAIIYGVLSIIPIALCFGLTTIFSAGFIFAAAVFYGLMGLGKKADRDTMRAEAGKQSGISPTGGEDGLVGQDDMQNQQKNIP